MGQLDVFGLLAAPGPFADYAGKLMLYGQFVGSWDSFLWLGEVSLDNGITWFLEQEMRALRRTAHLND